ncbi:hypothetical protein KM043_014415 [Ampulex compressa]|nr:hypothetical protein KM043_014415 [Ampulex compressa]
MRYTDLVIVLALSSITISTTKANSEVDGRRVVRGVTPLQVEDEGQSGYLVDDAQRVNDSESTYLLEGEQTNGNYSLEERRINDEVERAEDFYAEDVEGKGTSPFEAGQGNGSYFFEGQINSNYSVEETKNEDDYYVEETHRYNDYPFEEGYKNDTQAVEGEDEGKPAKEIDNTQMDASESMYNLQFIRKKVEKLIEEVDKSVEFLAGTQTADHESLISWKNVAHKAQTLFDITRNLSSETFPAQQKTEINETVHSADESEILAASSKRHVKVAPTPVPSSAFSSPTSVLKINPLHVLEKLNCELEAISYGHDHEAGIAAHEVLCEIRKLWHLLLLSGKNLKSEMSVGPLMGHDDDGTLSLQDLTSSKVPSTLIQHGPAIMEALIKDPNHLSVLPDILKESVPLAHIVESLHRLEGAVGKFFLVLRDSFEPHLGKHEHVKVLNDLNDKLLMIVPNFLKRINEHLETKLSKEQSSVPAKSMDPEESATTNFLKETNGSPISLANYMELMKETVNILHSVYGAYHASGFSDFLISARKIFSEISTENIGKLVNVVPFNKCLLHSTCKDDSKAVNGGTLNDPQIVAASSFGEVSIGNPFSSISSNLDKLPIDALQSGLASSSSAVSSAMNTIQDIPQNIVKLKGRKGVILSDPQTVATSAYTQVVVEDEASSNTKIENQANLIDPSIDDLQTTGASFSSVVFPSLNSIADVPQNIAAELKNTLPFGIAETSSNSDSSSLVSVTTNGGAGNDPTLIKLPFDTFQSTLSSSSSAISETLNGVNDVPQKAVLGIVNLSPIEVVGSSSDCDPSASIPFPESIQINPSNSLTSAVEYQPTFVNIPADGSQSISSSMVSSTVNSIKDTPQKVVPGLANLWPEYASGSATSGSSSLSTTNFSPPFDVPFGFRSSSATSSVSSTIGDVSRNILAVVKDASPPKSWRPFFPPSEAGAVLSDQIVALDGATSSASELRPVVLKNGLRSPLAKIVESAQVNVTEVSQSIPNVSKKSSTSIKENAGPSVKEKIKVPHGRNHTRQKTRGKSSRVKERPCHSRKVPNACTETPSLIKATEDTIVPAIDKVLLPWTDLLSSKTQTTSSPTSNQSSVKNTFYDEILSSLVLYLNGENSQKNRKSSKTDENLKRVP